MFDNTGRVECLMQASVGHAWDIVLFARMTRFPARPIRKKREEKLIKRLLREHAIVRKM